MNIQNALIATGLLFLLYLLAGVSVRERWNHKVVLNPLKIIAGVSRRASLSNAQVFYFTLIVAWLALYWVLQTDGTLVPINNTVLGLLGITAIGTGASKTAAISRFRVTGPNWGWLKKKGWIRESLNKSSENTIPKLSDLITSDQGFEIAKFQAVVFSAVVGMSLLISGAMVEQAADFSNFEIDTAYLTLIGISQGVYVGGKLTAPNVFAELNQKLDELRKLELTFTKTVADSAAWKNASGADREMVLARESCAPAEYADCISTATDAAELVRALTGVPVASDKIEPPLPATA